MALTPTDTQANALTQQGGVTEPAGPPGVQYAGSPASEGLKLLGEFFKRLNIQPKSPRRSPAEFDRVEPRLGDRPRQEADPREAAPRVPTPAEESVMGEGYSYRATQKRGAKEVLTPYGQERFADRGQRAFQEETEESEILRRGNAALVDDAAGNRPAREGDRISSEEAADRILNAHERGRSAIVDTPEGIDFNFDRLQTGDDVKALINGMSEVLEKPIKDAKRGVRTHEQTLEAAEELLADELGFTKTILRRQSGGVLNPEQMTAARILLERGVRKLSEMSDKILRGEATPEDMLKFRRQMAIQSAIIMQVKGAQTEAARTMNAFNIPVGGGHTGMGSNWLSEQRASEINDLLNDSGGVDEVAKLARGFKESLAEGGRAGANKYVRRSVWSRANGMFQEAYVGGLLSWTTTHIKNAVATPVFMAYRVPEELLAGLFGTGERALSRAFGWKGTGEGVYLGEAAARIWGWKESFSDMWVVAYHAMKRGQATDQIAKTEQTQYRQITGEATGVRRIPMVGETLSHAIDILGKAVRVPQTLLLGADEFWKTGLQRGELNAQAYREAAKALNAGKSMDDAVDDGMMVILDPRAVSRDLTEHAREQLLQTGLGDLGKVLGSVQQWTPGRILIPFLKAPTWSIARASERHPALMWINPKFLGDIFSNNPAKRQKRLAQFTMGSGVTYLIAEQAMNGRITGSYPKSEKQRRMLPDNWQPYSLVFRADRDTWPRDKDGDLLPLIDQKTGLYNGEVVYVNYAGIEPVGAIIGMTAAVVEIMRREPDPVKNQNYVSALLLAAGDYFTQIPFMQGFSAIQSALRYGDIGHLIDSPMGNMLAIPTGELIRDVDGIPVPFPKLYSAAFRNIGKSIEPVRGSPNVPISYYTYEEVMKMPPRSDGGSNLELVGVPKGGAGEFFRSIAIDGFGQTMRDSPVFDTIDTLAIGYDVLGEQIDRSVRFDANPVQAMWNLMMPFKVMVGEEPDAWKKELVALGMPLRQSASKMIQNVRISELQRSEWTRIAKNEVLLRGSQIGIRGPGSSSYYSFREALPALIDSLFYNRQKTDHPNKEDFKTADEKKASLIKTMENKFYRSAEQILLGLPENEDLLRAVGERSEAILDIMKRQ